MLARSRALIHGLGAAILSLPQRFWATLDSDAIRIYQTLIYTAIFCAGVYMLFIDIPELVEDSLNNRLGSSVIWLGMCIIGPVITLTATVYGRYDRYVSLLGQVSGNVSVASVLLTFSIIVFVDNIGEAIFTPFITLSLGIWSIMLAIRDSRKVIHTEIDVRSR